MALRRRSGVRLHIPAAFALGALIASPGLQTTPVAAQDYAAYADDDGLYGEPPRERKRPVRRRAHVVHKVASRARASDADVQTRHETKPAEAPAPKLPLFAIVSIADQRISIYNHDGLVTSSEVSTGMEGHATPRGIYTILARERLHHSNIYSGAPMPFMQRVTWSGVAMHLGVVPGHPASHGCIRLPAAFAAKLWGMTKIGERVVIAMDDVWPSEFSHPSLPIPKMRSPADTEKPAPVAQSTPAASPTPVAQATPGAAQAAPAGQAAPLPSAPGAAAPATVAQPAAPPPQPPLVNPHQYAEQMRLKAIADATAAAKASKDAAAAVSALQRENARAEAELKSAEAAQALASARSEAADKAFEAAAAAVAAKQSEVVVATTEIKAAQAGEFSKAVTSSPSKAYERAVAVKDAAMAAKTKANAALAEATTRLQAAKAEAPVKAAQLSDAERRLAEAATATEAAVKARKEAERRAAPLSILISRKDGRIYVRQSLIPLFDAPITVRDPEAPLGTHLYIASAPSSDGSALKWTVMSPPGRDVEPPAASRRSKAGAAEQGVAQIRRPPSGPSEALERVEIAQDVRDRIAERLWTGASIIISDLGPSSETGADGTDLTVKLR